MHAVFGRRDGTFAQPDCVIWLIYTIECSQSRAGGYKLRRCVRLFRERGPCQGATRVGEVDGYPPVGLERRARERKGG